MDLPFLHGSIDRGEAERRLKASGTPGSYLLRSRDTANKSFAYSCLGNEMKIIHSKVDYTASGINIDNKPEPSLGPGTPLNQVVAFLNNTRRNLGLVVGEPLDRPAGGAAEENYNVGGDGVGGGAVSQPTAAPAAAAPTAPHPVAFNKNAVLARQEKSTSFFGKLFGKKVWADRWGELRGGKLTVYTSRANQSELAQINMAQVSTVDEADVAVVKKSFCFTIIARGEQSYFACNNSKERDAWLKALRGSTSAAGGDDDDSIMN